jgi:hypothetical protein
MKDESKLRPSAAFVRLILPPSSFFLFGVTATNLVRRLMAVSSQKAGVEPWQLSFKGALQTLAAFLPMLYSDVSLDNWCTAFVAAIATHTVGDHPDRYEPRVKKRRARGTT